MSSISFPKAVSGKPIIALKMSQTTVHPIAESGYSTSQLYDRARPSYSKEAVTFLLEKLSILPRKSSSNPSMRVLELGTGTGKFTCVLQDVLRGSNVEIIASEPLLSMRQEFKKNCPHIEVKDFAAENIGKIFTQPQTFVMYTFCGSLAEWRCHFQGHNEVYGIRDARDLGSQNQGSQPRLVSFAAVIRLVT